MSAIEWFRLWFSSPYYDTLYVNRNDEEAEKTIKTFIEYLNMTKGVYVLDVACGKGRHSRAFAAKGFDVTGIDISASSIIEAKKYETDNLQFYVHDMRLPFRINYFDYAFNFFTSFGYFRTIREHNDAIRTIAQSLKLNGIFVIDYLNVQYAEKNMVSTEEKTIDNIHYKIKRWFNEERFYKTIDINDEEKNITERFTEQVKKFSLEDFRNMFSHEGLKIENVFGSYQLDAYDIKESPRTIMIAKKIHF